MALWILSRTTRVSRYQKGKTKTNLDLLEQETVSGSSISWAICKSAPRPRPPLHLGVRGLPYNTPMPGATPLTISLITSRTFAQLCQKLLHWLQWDTPYPPPKLPLCVGQLPTPINCLILGLSQPTNPNGTQIQSAVFPQSTGQTDRKTDRQTDRWSGRQNLYQHPLMLY